MIGRAAKVRGEGKGDEGVQWGQKRSEGRGRRRRGNERKRKQKHQSEDMGAGVRRLTPESCVVAMEA